MNWINTINSNEEAKQQKLLKLDDNKSDSLAVEPLFELTDEEIESKVGDKPPVLFIHLHPRNLR